MRVGGCGRKAGECRWGFVGECRCVGVGQSKERLGNGEWMRDGVSLRCGGWEAVGKTGGDWGRLGESRSARVVTG
eukprot:1316201-Rhodomonas_salina.2